ncbi:hypothetical protein AB6O97_02975 [Streptococcus mutans]|uniref:hypothetical protein n=1 Tax=Streptococcus mutans TaxID=1309 RepID=UPI0002B50E97|nr:hypothetical protein [Streptococcus mutans]EMC29339.1 hypothetical protein SMU86_08400 [Streptococcus mutans U2A]EMC62605.1 hypothetical protein SMU101_00035 [Streptococcus mutans U2B]
MTDIVDIYLETRDFHEAVKQSGLPTHVAHLKLIKSGCLKIQDKIQYGSRTAKLGGLAEELFQKYVPEATDANKYFKKNNPVYDFWFDGLTIDVKYSSLHKKKNGNSQHWQFRTNGSQDFIVAFLERESDSELNQPNILLVPMQFIEAKKELHVSQSGPWFQDFKVEPEELQPLLKDYAQLRKDGLF